MALGQLASWVRISVLLLALSPLAARGFPRYSFVDLGAFPDQTFSSAFAINGRGDVGGQAQVASGADIPTIWRSGIITGLALPQGYVRGAVISINSGGVSVGVVSDTFSASRAAEWSHDGTVTLLEGANSGSRGVNNAGYVAGLVGPSAAIWSPTGTLQLLGTLGGTFSSAFGINDDAVVVGASHTTDNAAEHAFRWDQAGGMQDLGTLPGFALSDARAINNRGEIVGGVSQPLNGLPPMTTEAFVWTADEGMQDLGWIAGAEGVRAFGINDRGEAVGIVTYVGERHDGFLYVPNEGLALLSDLTPNLDGWALQETYQINDRGDIVGKAVYRDGTTHAFELVPEAVPEPGSLALFVVAFAGIGLARQRTLMRGSTHRNEHV